MKINRKKVIVILTIISIIIIILGIISGICVSNELINSSNNNNIYIDGTNFSSIVEATTFIGSKILGFAIVFYSLLLDVVIWGIYGIFILTTKIVKRIKKKRSESNE